MAASSNAAQLRWLSQCEEDVVQDDLTQLISETRGVMEKLADAAVKLGAWQMVLWQPRYVYAEIDHLCYQKVSTNDKPIGKPKKVPFGGIVKIDELEYGEFVVQCSGRDYTFKAVDTNQCTVMVHNLRQLLARFRESREVGATQADLSLRSPSRASSEPVAK